ncbi:hypothetical protein C7E20_15960 [Sphingobium sp. AEW4]|nr:hypothetical protein C7E20_15960 [Sphingobium sp. AEW4]
MAVGQTEGYQPLDRATPLHHFVVPLPLQGRNVRALLVDFARSASRRRQDGLLSRRSTLKRHGE